MPNPPGPPLPSREAPRFDWRPPSVWLLLVALVALFALRDPWLGSLPVQPVAYSEFLQQLRAGRFESVVGGSEAVEGVLKTPQPDGRNRVVPARVSHEMVARHGMSRELGLVSCEHRIPRWLDRPEAPAQEHGLADQTLARIDAAVRALVDEACTRATALLRSHRTLLDDGAARLLAQETLTEAELRPFAEAAASAVRDAVNAA